VRKLQRLRARNSKEDARVSVKVQVIFYSMYGHIRSMAEAVVEGAREVEGAEVGLYQVAELIPEEALERMGAKSEKSAAFSRPLLPSTGARRLPSPVSTARCCITEW
jgi:hypothetical protein